MNLKEQKKVECNCYMCQCMCKASPCFGTPDDVFTQIAEGHIDKLAFTIFVDVKTNMCHALVAPLQKPEGGCVFFDGKYCTIHHIKGIEGKILSHKHSDEYIRQVRIEVCNTWESPLGIAIIKKFNGK